MHIRDIYMYIHACRDENEHKFMTICYLTPYPNQLVPGPIAVVHSITTETIIYGLPTLVP
jgi:hypothetical protein